MRQDCFDFIKVQIPEQSIEKHDALGFAKATEVSVAMRAALGAIHHEQAAGVKPAFLQQRFNA